MHPEDGFGEGLLARLPSVSTLNDSPLSLFNVTCLFIGLLRTVAEPLRAARAQALALTTLKHPRRRDS